MSSIAEIEAAIEKLPASEIEQLAAWLETLRVRRATPSLVENWLKCARGVALPGVTTANVIGISRDEA
jgi:hypothetical protein